MKSAFLFVVAGASLAAGSSAADAAFVGFSATTPVAQTAGRWVWSVYANFSQADDRLVNLSGFQLTSGSMSGVQHRDYGSSTWNPAWNLEDGPSWAGSDSWVSIDGNYMSETEQTTLSWPGAGSTIPNGAGWGQSLSSGGVIVGATLKIKIMQIAGTYLAPGSPHFSFSLNADWRDNGNAAIQSGNGTTAIPVPAVTSILVLSGLFGSRSRRR